MSAADESARRDGDAFARFADEWRPRVEATLEQLLPPANEPPEDLHRAMRHAMFPGGKRLRPVLVLAGAFATGGDPARALLAAAATECLHTYSLIHDDLPCMDDDDLRRGRPTVHKAFDEATAVLAGDALQTLAFAAVADGGAEAVLALARASGSRGMVGGQAADMAGERRDPRQATVADVEWIHDRKTGALIAACLEIGAIAGGMPAERLGEARLDALRRFGKLLGRAFQIADDCLDVTATAAELGKPTRQDAAASKLTYPAVLGLPRSLEEAMRLAREAAALAPAVCGGGGEGGGGAAAPAEAPSAGPGRTGAGTAPGTTRLDAAVRLLQDAALRTVTRKA